MTLPGSYLFSLILLILSLICLGTWANFLKAAGPKWRFELFAYDFAIGVLIAALIGGFTFGTLGLDGFTVMDDFRLAGKRQDLFAFLAGSIFSVGNILLMGSVSLAGMSVAFPICFGVAISIGVVTGIIGNAGTSLPALLVGAVASLAAVVLGSFAWKKYRLARAAAQAQAAAALASQEEALDSRAAAPRPKKIKKRKAAAGRAILTAVLGGLLLGFVSPLINMAKEGENGLGPYSATVILAVGVLVMTFVANLFFTNLPLQGSPLEFKEYLMSSGKQHLTGISGGMLWCCGALTALVAARAEGGAIVAPGLIYALNQAPVLIAGACGLFVWREFSDVDTITRPLLFGTLALLAIGIGLISSSSLYIPH